MFVFILFGYIIWVILALLIVRELSISGKADDSDLLMCIGFCLLPFMNIFIVGFFAFEFSKKKFKSNKDSIIKIAKKSLFIKEREKK